MANNIETVVITKLEMDASQAIEENKKLEDQQDKTIESTEDLTDATADYTGALDGMLDSMGVLPASMTKGLKGVTGLTKGFKGLKLAIIATGIGALIIALGAVYTWFNRTAEGQEKLAVGLAFLGQIVDVLLDGFADLGEGIFKAFEDPKQAVKDLWEFIKQNIVNRVQALGLLFSALKETITAAFTPGKSVKDGLADLSFAVVQLTTGFDEEQVTGFYDTIVEKGKEALEVVKESGELQRRANALERERIAFMTTEATLQARISEARLAANDLSASEQEQLKGSQLALELTQQLFQERIDMQAESVAILKEQQALGHNTIEDNRMMQEEETKLIALGKQRDDQLRSINTKYQTNLKKVEDIRAAENESLENSQRLLDRSVEANKVANLTITQDYIDSQKRQSDAAIESMEEQITFRDFMAGEIEKIDGQLLENLSHLLHMFNSENKEVATTQVLISSAVAVMKGFEKGLIFGTANAIAVGILATKSIQEIYKAEHGMWINGPSHRGGGVLVEAEGGEAIINKRSMANPALRQLASAINQAGGGVPFAENGMYIGNLSSSINSMNRDLQRQLAQVQPVLVLEDFHGANNTVMVKQDIATF